MSKSVSIKLGKSLSSKEFQSVLHKCFVEQKSEDEFLLKYNNKWIWCFYPGEEGNIDIQFSNDFTLDERISFLCEFKNNIKCTIVAGDL